MYTELIQSNIDVTGIRISERRSTPESFTLKTKKDERKFIIDQMSQLHLSPSEISWDHIESSKVVYIEQVSSDIGIAIAVFSRSRNITVVLSFPPLTTSKGLESFVPFLSQSDVLLIPNESWSALRGLIDGDIVRELRRYTHADIIARVTKRSYKHYAVDRGIHSQKTEHKTDISSRYISGLLRGLSQSLSIEESHKLGMKYEDSN